MQGLEEKINNNNTHMAWKDPGMPNELDKPKGAGKSTGSRQLDSSKKSEDMGQPEGPWRGGWSDDPGISSENGDGKNQGDPSEKPKDSTRGNEKSLWGK